MRKKRALLERITTITIALFCVISVSDIMYAMHAQNFLDAVCFGDAATVHEQLVAGIDVNRVDVKGGTPLYRALSGGNLSVAHVLLAHKADPNQRCKGECTPLMIAVRQGYEQLVDLLLRYRAAVDAESNKVGDTALRQAVERGYARIATILMAAGADPTKKARDGTSAGDVATPAVKEILANLEFGGEKRHEGPSARVVLDCCKKKEAISLLEFARQGNQDMVAALIAQNAPLEVCDRFGNTPLLEAVASGYQKVVAMLLEAHAEVDIRDADGRTSLMRAALRGDSKMVALLLDAKALVDMRDYGDNSALAHAATWGRVAVVSLLLEYNADMRARNAKGQAVLYRAVTHDREEVVKLLLEKNVCVDDKDIMGNTPLICAVGGNKVSLVQLLIAHNADVNGANVQGNVPLMWPVRRNKPRMIRILVEAGANPKIINKRGHSPWSKATKDMQSFIKHVSTKQRSLSEDIQGFIENMRTKQRALSEDGLMMKALLGGSSKALIEMVAGSPASVLSDYTETVLFRGSIRRTPVHAISQFDEEYVDGKNNELLSAAKVGNMQRVGEMIRDRACVNVSGRDGQTALFWAAHRGDDALVTLLIDNEAVVDQPDMLGFTPLMEAITYKHVGVVRLLLSHKADATKKNMCGVSSLEMAATSGASEEIITLLQAAVAQSQKDRQQALDEGGKPALQAEEPESDSNNEDGDWLLTSTKIARDV